MHERKVQMALRAGGFVGLPGGFGTFEEVKQICSVLKIAVLMLIICFI